MKKITVAHSPDSDDIFMYMAVDFGWVNSPWLGFSHVAADIETLNLAAMAGTYDVCAISFAAYPLIREDYALLRTAVSFGQGYGPKLVKRRGTRLRPNFKVALSGEHTTNALLFRIAYPKARVEYRNFLDIERAVVSGEVDAGVLIHESILDFSPELEVEREIWDIWTEFAGDLPLPLGGMALRRSLPLTDAIEAERVLTEAVRVADANKSLLSRMLLERGLVRIGDANLDKYLSMYANENSVSMDATQLNAVQKLFDLGFERGFYDAKFDVRDFLVPSEYNDFRFA